MFITDKLRADVEPLLLQIALEAQWLSKGFNVWHTSGGDLRQLARRAVERSLQVAIECMADIGNALIDTLLMRDPSSYADIISILADEAVLDSALAEELTRIVAIRKILAQDYLRANENEAKVMECAEHAPALLRFVDAVRRYLAVS